MARTGYTGTRAEVSHRGPADVQHATCLARVMQRSSEMSLSRTLHELVVGGAQIAIHLLGAPLLRRGYNRWGATEEEVRQARPGDALVPSPKLGYTRAITIDAPQDEVWRWLVQLGQGRAGFYSYDALENLVGCQIHSVDRILPEHQQLQRHDLVRSGPGDRPCWEVIEVDPPPTLVLMGAEPSTRSAPPVVAEVPERGYTASTWQWRVRSLSGGRSRLIVRQRLTFSPGQRLLWHIVEPINFVMERAMLRGIARRAERAARPTATRPSSCSLPSPGGRDGGSPGDEPSQPSQRKGRM